METRNEEIWQELIESKDFDQLSNRENAFVLGRSTEANYQLERTVLLESKILHQEVEPLPLILEDEKKAIVIPLYQTILAVAAAFVLSFLLFRSNGSTTGIQENQPLASTDTVYVEKQIIDTVFQTKTEYIKLVTEKTIIKEANCPQSNDNMSAVLSNQSNFVSDLSATALANKGTSAANDETLVLMEGWVGPE